MTPQDQLAYVLAHATKAQIAAVTTLIDLFYRFVFAAHAPQEQRKRSAG